MKKFIFMLVATLMLAIGAVNAQEQSNYAGSSKFTDNVSVTLQGGVLTTFNDFYTGHTAMAPIAVLGVDKYINPWFGVGVEGRTLIGTGNGMYNAHTAFDAVNVSGYAKFNILNMFNYNGERKFFEPVVYTGLGWGHQTCSAAELRNYMTYRAGAEFNFNLGKEKAWAIVVNPSVVWNDIYNGKLVKQNGNFEVTAGVVYHFKTSNDKHSIAMPRLYDAAEVAALNARINELMKRPAVVKEVVKEVSVNTTIVDKTHVVVFAQNSSELTPEAKAVLNNVSGTVNVVASASPEGTSDYNKKLSEKRANAVANYLKGRGVKVNTVTGVGVQGNTSNRIAIVTVE